MTQPHVDTHANGFVAAGVEKCWSRFDTAGLRCTTFSSSSAKARMANTSRGRFTPPTKTTRAKHTRRTTPTSPSWRFTKMTIPAQMRKRLGERKRQNSHEGQSLRSQAYGSAVLLSAVAFGLAVAALGTAGSATPPASRSTA